ncbi:MAG: aminotransferase class I/II-fold pyridoxal phosphate-dependent enzyme [Acidobacteria bacterium]|nr:aminotransferase class I/II-fold pyridoxal phosphate-dependent enzyme [Acidobacteriota bacterium]
MRIQSFKMERWQSLHDQQVKSNLSESGVQPMSVRELVEDSGQFEDLLSLKLGYGHTSGSPELCAQIAGYYPGATPENVLVTCGGAEANYLAFWSLLESGDRVAVEIPNYMQTVGLARAYGGSADRFYLKPRREGGNIRWALDLESLDRAVTRKTRILLITNPHNPTGAILSEEEMEAILRAARRVGAWIVSDEIYRGAEISGRLTASFWGRYHKVIVTAGLSKAFGLPGLRIGWLVAPCKTIADCWSHKDYTTIAPSSLSDRLAAIAMAPQPRARILERTRAILKTNLPVLDEWVRSHGNLLEFVSPAAGAIAFLRYRLPLGSLALVEKLKVEHSVLIVAGDQCGLGKHIRIGYGSPREELLQGLSGIDRALAGLSEKSATRAGGKLPRYRYSGARSTSGAGRA